MAGETILIVDDESAIRGVVSDILGDENYHAVSAENAEVARARFAEHKPDLVLLDIWMPGTDGISLLREWMDAGYTETPVIMISGHGNVETAVEAIQIGAYDFLEKPLSTGKLLVTVKHALEKRRLSLENRRLRDSVQPIIGLTGKSEAITSLRETIERVGKTDSWVLITGEAGVGKNVVARAIHEAGSRKEHPFVDVNIAATPVDSVPQLLFGSEGAAVSGAQATAIKPGCFEQACGGSLLLDEIGDMDPAVQTRLVNALEEGSFLRLHGNSPVNIDVRILAATNQNLEQAIKEARFREDLYYRLNVIPIAVPTLRDHVEDIPELVDLFVERVVVQEGVAYKKFTVAALNRLRQHSWPGNIRELKNLVQRLMIISPGEAINDKNVDLALSDGVSGSSALHQNIVAAQFDISLREARDNFERAYLVHHLERMEGSMSELANVIGIERTHLYRKLKSLNVDPKAHKK